MYRGQLDYFPLETFSQQKILSKKGFEKTFHIQQPTLANLKVLSSSNKTPRECALVPDPLVGVLAPDQEHHVEQSEQRTAESRIETVSNMCSLVAENSSATINANLILIVSFLYVKWLMITFLVPQFNEFMETICFIWVWIPVLFIQCSVLYNFPYVAVVVFVVYSILTLQLYLVITFSYSIEYDNYFFIFHMCYQCALYWLVRQRTVFPIWLFLSTTFFCVVVRTVTFNSANIDSFTGSTLCQTAVTVLYNSFMFIMAIAVLVDTSSIVRSKEDGKER